jgi:hypothetical protein
LAISRPEIFNTDQGSQLTTREYTGRMEEAGIAVSRDGRGRALVERPTVVPSSPTPRIGLGRATPSDPTGTLLQ